MRYWCGLDAKSFEEAEIDMVSAGEVVIRFLDEGRKGVRIFRPKFESFGGLTVIEGVENAPEGWKAITMYALEKRTLEEKN